MKIILKEDLEHLGLEGEVVEVKPGYGRNYLIPRGLAVVATDSNRRRFEEERRQRQHKLDAQRKDAEALANRLGTLEAKGIELDRRKITLPEEIRHTGVYTATVKLHPEHTAEVKVKVVPEEASL